MNSLAEQLARVRLPEELEVLLARIDEGVDARPELLERYRLLAAQPRLDQDCRLRWLLLSALRGRVRPGDADLLEAATGLFEYLPSDEGPVEMAHGIRAAGLLALFEVDRERARWRALDLLADGRDNEVSGDPARAAVRVLGVCDEVLLIDAIARHDAFRLVAPARAEALLWLGDLPETRLRSLVELFVDAADEAYLLAVVDLALLKPQAWLADIAVAQLTATRNLDVYRYAVLQAVAKRRFELIDSLRSAADRPKAELLYGLLGPA